MLTKSQEGSKPHKRHGWMSKDKENAVYFMYNEILLSLNKEGNVNTCYNMNEP